MELKINNSQSSFKAKLHVEGIKFKPKDYRNLVQYTKKLGHKSDKIYIGKDRIKTFIGNKHSIDNIDILGIKPNKRVQKIKEKINLILGISAVFTGANVIEETNENNNVLKTEDSYQEIVKTSEKLLEVVEELKLPSRVKLYHIGKEPKMEIANLTKEGFEAKLGNSTYFYKVINKKINPDALKWRLFQEEYEMQPSTLAENLKIMIDKIQVGEHTLQVNYSLDKIENLELKTKLPSSFNDEILKVTYQLDNKASSNEYEDSYVVARPFCGKTKFLNNTYLDFYSNGKLYGVKAEQPINNENITTTLESIKSKTEEVKLKLSNLYDKHHFESLIKCLKEKLGNMEFITDEYEKINILPTKFNPPYPYMYKEYSGTLNTLNKIVLYDERTLNPKYKISIDEKGGYIALRNPKYDIHVSHLVPTEDDDIFEKVVDIASFYDFRADGRYINDHQIEFTNKEDKKPCFLNKREGLILDTKDESITAINYRGDYVLKERLPYNSYHNCYEDYIDFLEIESQDTYSFKGYYTDNYCANQMLAGEIYKDGKNILAMSLTKSTQQKNNVPEVQYSITKYPDSEEIIISSKRFDEVFKIKANNIKDLEEKIRKL